MNDAASSSLLDRRTAVHVLAALSGAYLLSYGMRSINAAIAPELVAEFALSNADLGYLSSTYFLAFALIQLPLGVWLDRFGTRRVHASLLLIAALGCLIFGTATSQTGLWFGRVLIGAGFAGGLMGSLRGFRFWFAADRQQQLLSMMLVVGSTGALLASSPSRALLPLIGWRGLFVGAAGLLALASLAVFLLLPRGDAADGSSGAPSDGAASGKGFAGYLIIFRDPFLWRFAVASMVLQAGFIAFQSLWIGPWFTQVLDATPGFAANVIFAFNLVLLLSFLALGMTARRLARRGVSLERVCQIVILMIVILHLTLSLTGSVWLAVVLWLAYAIISPPLTLLQTHVGMSFPAELTGRAFTGYNLLVFGSMFLVQWLFGVLVDWCLTVRDTEADAFRLAMQIWVAIELAALLWLSLRRAVPYQERMARDEAASD